MKKFHIDVGSDQKHEDLVAEIYYDDEYVGMITQESGFDSLDLEIGGKISNSWIFKYDDFIEALAKAKQRLWDLRKNF